MFALAENRIRLVLLDDHDLLRVALARYLESQPGLEIISECGTSAEALQALSSSPVDVVLLDFDLGAERGHEFLYAARQAGYQGQFIIIAGQGEIRAAAIALKLGASGIFLKSEAPDRLVKAIRLVSNGQPWIDPKVIHTLADQVAKPLPLTRQTTLADRERQVLLGILGGRTNREIGENIGLSESSVKNVVQRLFRKAGVNTRTQLVRIALEGSLGAATPLSRRIPPLAAFNGAALTTNSGNAPTPPEPTGSASARRSS